MLMSTGSRKLVPLLLVAVYNLKHITAIQDSNFAGDLAREIVQIQQVGGLPRDAHGGTATASVSTRAGNQSQNIASLTAQHRIRKAVESVWRKLSTRIFGTTKNLSDEKKGKIHEHLEANKEQIMAMKMEYESLLKSSEELEQRMTPHVRKGCQVIGNLSVIDIIRELKKYHKEHVLNLVQDRIYKLGGIGVRMSSIGSLSHSQESDFRSKRILQDVLSFISSYLRGEKRVIRDESIDVQNKKRVEQDLSPSASITKKEPNQLPDPPKTLSGDHLDIVKGKVKTSDLEDLRKILHSMTFEVKKVWRPDEWHVQAQLPFIKIAFEKCAGFEVLAYLYKFELITKDELNSFFEAEETLDLTARHLFSLFPVRNLLREHHVLIPDIDFIANDWHTVHLRYLKDLKKEKQQYIVYEILKWNIENCIERIFEVDKSTPEAEQIFHSFQKDTILQEIMDWSPKPWDKITKRPSKDLMRENIEAIICLFNDFPMSIEVPSHESMIVATKEKQKVEFLLIYYMIRFLKTFGNENVKDFIQAYSNGDWYSEILLNIYGKGTCHDYKYKNPGSNIFNERFALITFGLQIHQITNQIQDYSYFLSYPETLIHLIPSWINPQAQETLRHKRKEFVARYWSKYNQINELSGSHEVVKYWKQNEVVQDILAIFDDIITMKKPIIHYNMWLKGNCLHLDIKPTEKEEIYSLALRLSFNYNVIDKYHEWSLKVYQDLVLEYFKGKNNLVPTTETY